MRRVVSKAISDWFEKYNLAASFDRAYLFGSLVNDRGDFFWPSGVKNSDIDLLIRFNPELCTAALRTLALAAMQECLPELEETLVKKLKRGSGVKGSVMSILPVTWYEVYHCIHKGFDPKIFTLNIFYDVLTKRTRKGGLSDFIDKSYQFDNTETFAVMRLCQKLRNSLLKASDNGEPELMPFDTLGAVPKEIMRAAALLNFVDTNEKDPEIRTNLLEGEEYVADLIKSRMGDHELIAKLDEKIRKRRSTAAYKKPALSPIDLILLSELLFDEARILSQPSVRQTIDRMRREKQGKSVYV